MISAVIFLVASIVMFFAPDYETLLCGRLAVGLGVGCCCMVVPVYIAETAPANLRGSLVTVNTVMIVFGQVVSALINCPLASVVGGWRYMLELGAFPALVMIVGLLFLPESPRWLVQQGRSEEALKVLHSVREELDEAYTVQDEIQAIKKQVHESKDDGWSCRQKLCQILSDVRIRSALAVGCVLHLAQQISGINTMMCYSANILQSGNGSADEENPLDPDAIEAICLSAITATANLIGNLVAMCFAERCGRRVLMLGSLSGACVSLFVLGFAFHTTRVNELVVVASMMTFLLSYGCGLAPMPWTVNAEIYPLYARSICVSIATGVNWTMNVIVSLTFLDLGENMSTYRWKDDLPMEDREKEIKNHPDGVFWLYSVLTALCGIWLWFKMPETKGLTLEETIDQFDAQKPFLLQNAAAGDGSHVQYRSFGKGH
jgi:sugar porter (SP) family MFS transporter